MEEKESDLEIEESDTIEKEKILLNRPWSFWENYEEKSKDKNYSESFKRLSKEIKEEIEKIEIKYILLII